MVIAPMNANQQMQNTITKYVIIPDIYKIISKKLAIENLRKKQKKTGKKHSALPEN